MMPHLVCMYTLHHVMVKVVRAVDGEKSNHLEGPTREWQVNLCQVCILCAHVYPMCV